MEEKRIENLDISIEFLSFLREKKRENERWGNIIPIEFYSEKKFTPDYIEERIKYKENIKKDLNETSKRGIGYHTIDFSIHPDILPAEIFKEIHVDLIYIRVGLVSFEKALQKDEKEKIIDPKLKTDIEQKALNRFGVEELRIFKEEKSEKFREIKEKLRYCTLVWFNVTFNIDTYLESVLSKIEEQKIIFNKNALNDMEEKMNNEINDLKRRIGEYIRDEFIYLTHKEGVRRRNLCDEFNALNQITDLGIPSGGKI